MKLRWKITLTVVTACALNIALLAGFYGSFVTKQLVSNKAALEDSLGETAQDIAVRLENGESLHSVLEDSAENGLYFRIKTSEGLSITNEKEVLGGSYVVSAEAPVQVNGSTYFVEASRMLQSRDALRYLFWAEMMVLPIILAVMMVIIYMLYIKPMEQLQKDITGYNKGTQLSRVERPDEIGNLHNAFVDMTYRLDQERQKQDRIIASISHDIKTPLTSVMGYTERLRKGGLAPQRQERYINTIYERSIAIRDLIDEFDDYLSSHLQGSLRCQQITVEDLCRMVTVDNQEELGAMGIGLTVENRCPQALLWADIGKLRRVFGNIIGNSVKHMKGTDRRIEVAVDGVQEGVRVAVSDNGEGVPQEDLDRIFEALYTSDESRSVAGLGLAICKEIIEAHGGRIWAENRPGGGLTVVFVLRLWTGEAA
jgi:signal transduction histidine kinase